jgi:hypothetical protein
MPAVPLIRTLALRSSRLSHARDASARETADRFINQQQQRAVRNLNLKLIHATRY